MSRSITLTFFLALLFSMSISTPVASPQELKTHGGAPLIAISVVQPTLPAPVAPQAPANAAPAQNATITPPATPPSTAPAAAANQTSASAQGSQGGSQGSQDQGAAAATNTKNQPSNA